MSVRDEREARALFDRRYGTAQVQVQYEIERRVIGGDWGANGYTTMAQADALASGLGLSASDLDVMLAFRATAAAWLAQWESHADELARLEPPGAFEQRLADRRALLAAVDAGLLRRAMLVARRR